jgi:predicted amidohydrolase YtcJ
MRQRFTEELPEGRIAPGYIDAHCHILPTGLDLLKLSLRECSTPDEVLEAVRTWHEKRPDGWLHAVHYDQTKFPGAKHLTRSELDTISPTRPILLRHSNGHASVANTAALEAAGVGPSTPNPAGGEYVRDESGHMTGVLLEDAHTDVTASAPGPTLDEMIEAILRAGELMASYGITAGTDMMTGRWSLEQELEAYRIASERDCAIRLRLSLQWSAVLGRRGMSSERLQEHIAAMEPSLCKIIGLKIFADGAIGSATAAIHRAYKTTGGQGQLIYSPERLTEMVVKATEAGWSVAVHSIGDGSTDHVLDAFEASGGSARHRIEHVMILSDAQIERLARNGCHVTLQPEFLYRFGHAYRAQLPDDVWPSLKRARSLIDAGLEVSFNTDRPIVLGIPRVGIDSAVNRPEGYDPAEAVTVEEGEWAWTRGAALANGDTDQGEIKPGCHADYRLLDEEGDLLALFMGGRETWRRAP